MSPGTGRNAITKQFKAHLNHKPPSRKSLKQLETASTSFKQGAKHHARHARQHQALSARWAWMNKKHAPRGQEFAECLPSVCQLLANCSPTVRQHCAEMSPTACPGPGACPPQQGRVPTTGTHAHSTGSCPQPECMPTTGAGAAADCTFVRSSCRGACV